MNKRFSILAVDDDPTNMHIMVSALKDEYDIIPALNGFDAIEQLKLERPDLILLDVLMPDINGFDVCKIIKADEMLADIPVIFLTALDTHEGELQGLELGGIDYIYKPINFTLLKLRIRNQIALKEQRDLVERQKRELARMLAEQELQNRLLHETKESLRQSGEMYRTLFSEMLDGFALHEIMCDTQGKPTDYRFIAVNPAFERLTGLSAENILGCTVLEVMPDTELHWIETYGKVALTGEPAFFENYSVALNKHFEVKAFRPAPNQFACIFADITDKKKAEEVLLESEARHRAILRTAMDGIWSVDRQGRLIEVNETYCRMSGYSMQELLGMSITDLEANETVDNTVARIRKIMLEGEARFESRHLRKDGTAFDVEVSVQYRPVDGGQFIVFLRDISDLKKGAEEKEALEQQLQQAQRLESLGVLAGGIAHDFNNILAIIMGYCSLIKMDYDDAETHVPEIEKAAERAAGLCRQMLAYSGKTQIVQVQVNLWLLVDEMVAMLKAALPRNTVIKPFLSTDIPIINGDERQLRQIVMNLIINASEAVGEAQGEVRVSLVKTTITAGHPEHDYYGKEIPPGGYVCLEVTDNGCGMDEETKWRIFEPFYTTKFTGRGLGMSAVLCIITAHKGALQLFSQPGQGTTFKVYLPVQGGEQAEEESHELSAASGQWQGSGTILLVEDEDQVRFIAATILKKLGCTVLEAANGREALELYRKNAADIILVITDMGMPIMDGYELFRELKNLQPELPIIISSGFGDAVVTSRIPRENIAGLVSKPYNYDLLREVMRNAVGKTARVLVQ
jgi:PAS domain S-box-containing protein